MQPAKLVVRKIHPVECHPKLIPLPLPPSVKELGEKTYEAPKLKNRAFIKNAFNTINPLVTVKNFGINQDLVKKICMTNAPAKKPKLKLDDAKLKLLKELDSKINKMEENKMHTLIAKQGNKAVIEETKVDPQHDFAQLLIPPQCREKFMSTALDDEKDNVLMDSISAPQSPHIGTQESWHQRFECRSTQKQSPFSEVMDKRVSEYLGNKSYIAAKNCSTPLAHT